MNWSYIAGYSDGESSLLLGIAQDKREKSKNSKVEGWNIIPNWCISSYDYKVLEDIRQFLISKDIRVKICYLYPKKRYHQTKEVMRLSIFGWNNIEKFIKKILPFSISKKEQLIKFLNLNNGINKVPDI